MQGLKKILCDMGQSANGDWDPARVVGYGVTVIGAMIFFGLTIYVSIANKTFDGTAYSIGLAGISASIAASAAGVLLKKSTEVPLEPTKPAEVVTPPTDTPAQ